MAHMFTIAVVFAGIIIPLLRWTLAVERRAHDKRGPGGCRWSVSFTTTRRRGRSREGGGGQWWWEEEGGRRERGDADREGEEKEAVVGGGGGMRRRAVVVGGEKWSRRRVERGERVERN